jgi:hypothetical protein
VARNNNGRPMGPPRCGAFNCVLAAKARRDSGCCAHGQDHKSLANGSGRCIQLQFQRTQCRQVPNAQS